MQIRLLAIILRHRDIFRYPRVLMYAHFRKCSSRSKPIENAIVVGVGRPVGINTRFMLLYVRIDTFSLAINFLRSFSYICKLPTYTRVGAPEASAIAEVVV